MSRILVPIFQFCHGKMIHRVETMGIKYSILHKLGLFLNLTNFLSHNKFSREEIKNRRWWNVFNKVFLIIMDYLRTNQRFHVIWTTSSRFLYYVELGLLFRDNLSMTRVKIIKALTFMFTHLRKLPKGWFPILRNFQ